MFVYLYYMSFAWKVNPFFALINCMHKKISPGHSKLRNKLRGKARGLVLSPAFAGTKKSAKESPALRQAFHSALFVLLFYFPGAAYLVVLPSPPLRISRASSSSVMPKGRKIPCIYPCPAATATVFPSRESLVSLQ